MYAAKNTVHHNCKKCNKSIPADTWHLFGGYCHNCYKEAGQKVELKTKLIKCRKCGLEVYPSEYDKNNNTCFECRRKYQRNIYKTTAGKSVLKNPLLDVIKRKRAQHWTLSNIAIHTGVHGHPVSKNTLAYFFKNYPEHDPLQTVGKEEIKVVDLMTEEKTPEPEVTTGASLTPIEKINKKIEQLGNEYNHLSDQMVEIEIKINVLHELKREISEDE